MITIINGFPLIKTASKLGIYNHLPPFLVNLEDVSKFQSALTNIARWRCDNGVDDWKYSFSVGHPGAYVGTVYG